MSRYHGAGKSIIRRKDEATGSSAVFRRNLLLKRGQRGIRRGERTLRDDATGIRRTGGGDVGGRRRCGSTTCFYHLILQTKTPRSFRSPRSKPRKEGVLPFSFLGHYLLHLPPLVKKHPVGLEIDFFCLERTKNGLRLLLGYRIIVLSTGLCPGYGLEKDSLSSSLNK